MPHEKQVIVRAHEYFLNEAQQRLDPERRAVRQRVAACLAASEDVVKPTMAHWNKHHDAAYSNSGAYIAR
ncbi:hypothetical protein PI125_g17243 [Phytophthora idaei]|nr:hypothetical protein PI125_g17243 [Phytophthora idaei]